MERGEEKQEIKEQRSEMYLLKWERRWYRVGDTKDVWPN